MVTTSGFSYHVRDIGDWKGWFGQFGMGHLDSAVYYCISPYLR